MTTVHERTRATRVLVSNMSPLMESGIVSALSKCGDIHVEADDIKDASQAERLPFDIVITDYQHGTSYALSRAGADGSHLSNGVRLFVLACNSDQQDVRLAIERGVHGYAMSGIKVDELQAGVRALSRGERFICAAAAMRLADSVAREGLTARETMVLKELARGSCNKTIASRLGVSVGTIKAHLRALMTKLEARSRTQVVTVAISRGLVSALHLRDSPSASDAGREDGRPRFRDIASYRAEPRSANERVIPAELLA
jgi:DNA-binding NarL/FixJ family response regulator